MMNDIRPLKVSISIADIDLTCGNNIIILDDVIDGRNERYICSSQQEACEIISAFMQSDKPGKAFAKAFPFWV